MRKLLATILISTALCGSALAQSGIGQIPSGTLLGNFSGVAAQPNPTAGPFGFINTTVPASFTTPGYSFNDGGTTGLSFSDGLFHYAFTVTGNTPATGTGSYTALVATQFGTARDASAFVTGTIESAIATGGSGNYTGSNPYVVVCGTAVVAGQCPFGTAATLNTVVGAEIDIFSNTGATFNYKEGLRIADLGVIQASGAGNLSAGIVLVRAATSPGFVYGLFFGDPTVGDTVFPLTTTGAAIKLSTSARAIDSIIDGSGLAGGITNGAIRLPDGVSPIKWPSWTMAESSTLIAFQTSGAVNAALFQAAASTFSGTVQSGNPSTNAGAFILTGLTSGVVTIQPGAAAAGTFNFNLPVTSGSAGNVLASGGGGAAAMTWITGVTTVCTVTVGNSYTFTNGVLTTKGANCT